LKALVAGLIARPKVIAVIGATRTDVERAIRHARGANSNLPIWAYCLEVLPEDDLPDPAGCARFVSGNNALRFREDLKSVWPALSIIAWTGKHAPAALKLGAFFIPPFRVLVLNEAGDFFPATPAGIARHVTRRTRDVSVSHVRRTADWGSGLGMWTGSLAWRAGEHIRDVFHWAWEVCLAALAAAARWALPPVNSAVTGSRQPAIQQKPATGDRFVVVTIPNREWPRREVMRAVAGSDAEFVVLRGQDEPKSVKAIHSLLGVARETNAFAAARQTAHSAWRGRIVAKYPFRRLQPGEVSEVFAPFSSLIVLRRSTLSKLGVPHALTFGGALMMLFWKASSAGLRSIAVGHDDAVTDEPAMELEDAELSLRLKLSPSLRALGPLRPARFRGNIAWSPAHNWALRGRPRVLVVSPYLPFPLAHGGAVRIYNLCRALADRVDFVLACFREANERVEYERLHEVFREVYVVDQDEKRVDPAVPGQVAEYRNPAMADLIRTLCLEHRVDLVQLEYTQLGEYRYETGAVPVILVEHDITFTLYRQLYEANGRVETRREYDRWLEFEREALQCVNRVWTMSYDDRAEAIAYGAAERHAEVIPNGVDLERFKVTPRPDGPPTVLFVGSFRHLPNLLAFEALRESIMPEVWRTIPDAILHVIAGPDHERAALLAGKKALLKSDPRILVEGFVEDVRPAYSSADVIAVPLPLSAGTNIKVMEAMACGRAVVSTPAGCRGLELLEGRDLIVADADFANAIVELLENEDLRMKIAAEGRKTAERRFGWDAIAEDALRSYAALIGSPKHVERRLKLAAGVIVADRARDFDTPAV
jgi:glycosyltransferase involved in cell wall biosynthesis